MFLSCLGGSEHSILKASDATGFLSCLGGSELLYIPAGNQHYFLSCLGGSERSCGMQPRRLELSELPGRQRTRINDAARAVMFF
ncbi:hypothetical protein CZ787_10710 [Halomonas citrativorans]|uniref:Uncharacterized protein n=1 Tax=Halomonas citrativorans TaxID=2742612 RepID=A0A1R4I178_9GAMM|nr:hypothetical protein CZ787_10710 [Halomonas citrativorans]